MALPGGLKTQRPRTPSHATQVIALKGPAKEKTTEKEKGKAKAKAKE